MFQSSKGFLIHIIISRQLKAIGLRDFLTQGNILKLLWNNYYTPVDVIKLFGGNLDSLKTKEFKKKFQMSEPVQKFENNTIFMPKI